MPSGATSLRGRTGGRGASRAPARIARPRRRDAGRSRRSSSPAASPTGARSRSCCSSGTASSPATPSAAEGIPGGYGAVYGELRALETLGSCRRGYFVEGLGGAQFALGGAVERLRELRPREDDEPEPLVLAAADPAQPYGAVLPWPKRAGAPRRPRGGSARRAARRRARALRRARRPFARPAAGAGRGVAAARARGARRVRQARRCETARGRALRRRAGRRRRSSCRCSSRPASSPARGAPCCGLSLRADTRLDQQFRNDASTGRVARVVLNTGRQASEAHYGHPRATGCPATCTAHRTFSF